MNHELFMQRCFNLARSGAGNVAPNPLVGAVLVKNGEIIAEGYHVVFGGSHAEVNALDKIAKADINPASTLYVNLEPCSHFGKTPPCVNLILEKGINNVVISNKDPNPLVSGKGIALLKQAGVNVISGILEKEGNELNKRFFCFHQKKRPYIILKWAQSVDKYIAPRGSEKKNTGIHWISNETSRLLVHKWRGEESGILAGKNTIVNDNPLLTSRGLSMKNPVRIVIDKSLELDKSYRVFNSDAPTYVFNQLKSLTKENIEFIKINKSLNFLDRIMHELYQRQILSVLIEGGAYTITEFIKSNLWDEARVFTGAVHLGAGVSAPELNRTPEQTINIDGDLLSYYINSNRN